MGCCFSVDSEASKVQKKEKGFSHESRAPPPSAEEETVKEVLSEIPKSKLEPVLIIGGDIKQEVEETKDVQKAVFAKIQENHHHKHLHRPLDHRDVNENVKRQDLETNEENMSEASEICSLSLSMSESVSTTTVTDKRDNNEEEQEVRQQHRVSRSPAKLPTRNREYGVRRDRVVGQSPSRRSEQSPGKRSFNNGSARLVQNSSSREESGQPTARRVGSMPDPRRKDPGECSGRRSSSPAITRSATMNRSPSTRRRTNQSPGRVTESGMKKPEGKLPNNNNNSKNESLENPLVSLECFIFL